MNGPRSVRLKDYHDEYKPYIPIKGNNSRTLEIRPMNCPYCKRKINGFTGLQEVQKFQKHLNKCKKNPKRLLNNMGYNKTVYTSLEEALTIRAESGQ